MQGTKSTRRHFTDAARAAAMLARQRKALIKDPTGQPTVFAVRLPPGRGGFGWEIRRFGGLVLLRSQDGYPTPDAATDAGREALLSHSVEALRRKEAPGAMQAFATP